MSVQRLTRGELAADYVLGLAEGAEHERALRLLATDATFRAEVAALREKLDEIDRTAPASPPAETSWAAIESAIDAAPPAARATPQQSRLPRWWSEIAVWRPFALASAAAAALFAVALLVQIVRPPEQPVFVAVLQTGEGRAQAVVNAYADGTVTLVPIEAIGVPEGRIIEVWTLQSREQGPVSIGRMDRARTLKLDLKRLSRPDAGHLFEMTAEPPGGSPTGRPTGPVLSKGLAGQAL
jgi:anti-sigma-K factor RskA